MTTIFVLCSEHDKSVSNLVELLTNRGMECDGKRIWGFGYEIILESKTMLENRTHELGKFLMETFAKGAGNEPKTYWGDVLIPAPIAVPTPTVVDVEFIKQLMVNGMISSANVKEIVGAIEEQYGEFIRGSYQQETKAKPARKVVRQDYKDADLDQVTTSEFNEIGI